MKILTLSFFVCGLCYNGVNYQETGKQIKIIADYGNIKTIPQMLNYFKGKPVFIDLWATWCEPCIDAFSKSDSLYAFLSANHIGMLYLSVDKNEQDSLWKTMIRSHRLYGNHIRANKNLQDEITTLIWGAKDGYSLPHYLLYDKNGGLLNKDVPEAGAKLYREIEMEVNRH
jgi:thiol-disulfide isomerase/thioredoxin